ncbi:hypothetical protein K501DRAFT_277652 [Backusella circina FSU 941]|nr:hypothetical protein K501DRAFT_277652 [Backusella circina FSU 941]
MFRTDRQELVTQKVEFIFLSKPIAVELMIKREIYGMQAVMPDSPSSIGILYLKRSLLYTWNNNIIRVHWLKLHLKIESLHKHKISGLSDKEITESKFQKVQKVLILIECKKKNFEHGDSAIKTDEENGQLFPRLIFNFPRPKAYDIWLIKKYLLFISSKQSDRTIMQEKAKTSKDYIILLLLYNNIIIK